VGQFVVVHDVHTDLVLWSKVAKFNVEKSHAFLFPLYLTYILFTLFIPRWKIAL